MTKSASFPYLPIPPHNSSRMRIVALKRSSFHSALLVIQKVYILLEGYIYMDIGNIYIGIIWRFLVLDETEPRF